MAAVIIWTCKNFLVACWILANCTFPNELTLNTFKTSQRFIIRKIGLLNAPG